MRIVAILRPADRAWLALAAGVAAWDLLCPAGETLSEGADRYLATRPVLTHLVTALVALHLCNLVPARCDPLHLLFTGVRRLVR